MTIRERRKELGLTQKQLAEMVGAAQYSISEWEREKKFQIPA